MNWSEQYRLHTDRNIGILTKEQQSVLRSSKVAILGVGGLGGTCFEVLIRSGVGNFSIVDKDIFEPTNLNRQIFAFHSTVGMRKIDVAEKFALDINPEVIVERFDALTSENISEIFRDVDVVVLAIDELKPCIIASRQARESDIPLIEGWGLPYCNVRVITRDTPSLEDVYSLPTRGRSLEDIPNQELERLGLETLIGLSKIEDISNFYSIEPSDIASTGRIPTLGPLVWLTSLFMALETLKILLNWGNIAYAPEWSFYDPFRHRTL
ncbi:MAG: ThiF family adenylyltransferase [Myxococcota bacterium]|nr:ThiF family adenylyltransferase [Myxococcota bacterium]